MNMKITTAYQQFSHRIPQQSGTSVSESLATKSSVGETQNSEFQSAGQLSQQQRTQLRQLRDTGTLDNLQSILSEDEASLLSKLFPEERKGYDAGARLSEQRQHIKGSLLDTKL